MIDHVNRDPFERSGGFVGLGNITVALDRSDLHDDTLNNHESRVSILETAGSAFAIAGAVGDGVADDRAAIQAALDAAHAAGGGEVFFPRGTYRVTRPGVSLYCLSIAGSVRLRCAPGAVIQKDATLAGTSGASVAVINVQGNGISITGLKIDGNRQKTTYDTNFEHQAGIFAQSSDELTIRDVEITGCGGDGIQLYNGCTNVTLDHVYSHDNNRQGVSLTPTSSSTPVTGVRFIACRIINNAINAIDCEPSGTGTVSDVSVTGSYLDVGSAGTATYALSLASGSGWQVSGNRIIGSVTPALASNVTISGNEITDTLGSGAVYLYEKNQNVAVVGNVLRSVHAIANASCVRIVATAGGNMTFGATVSGNVIDCSGGPASISGILINTANDVVIEANTLIGPGLASANGHGMHLRSTETAEPFRSVNVVGNRVANFGSVGIQIAGNSTAQLLYARIANNTFDDTAGTMTTGVSLDDGNHALQAFDVIDNRALGGVSTALTNTPAGSTTAVAGVTGNTGWVAK